MFTQHVSLHSVLIYCCWHLQELGKTSVQFVVSSRECNCKMVRGGRRCGEPWGPFTRGNNLTCSGAQDQETHMLHGLHGECAQATSAVTLKPFIFILATLSIPKTARWSSRTQVNKQKQHDLTQLKVSLCSKTSFSRWKKRVCVFSSRAGPRSKIRCFPN